MEVLPEHAEEVTNENRLFTIIVKAYRPHGQVSQYMVDMPIATTSPSEDL
jgi:hypothetical protein